MVMEDYSDVTHPHSVVSVEVYVQVRRIGKRIMFMSNGLSGCLSKVFVNLLLTSEGWGVRDGI